jgi:hypothetical protein
MRFLYLLLLLVTTNVFATRQETISADCLKIQDGVCINKTELGSLSGATGNLQSEIDAHLTDTTDAHDASAISNVPAGNLSATDTQAAVNELQGDIDTANTAATALTGRVTTLEGYDKIIEYANFAAFPGTGAATTVYIDKALNKTYRWNGSVYVLIGDGQGTGDVVGPGAATDNVIARYDGATGKLIQNSGVIINDTNDITGVSSFLASSNITSQNGDIAGENFIEEVTTDASTTGANALVPDATGIVRFTNASLTSISALDGPADGRSVTLLNATGASITIVNNGGATSNALKILTGTGADITLGNKASLIFKYNNIEARWMVVGSSTTGLATDSTVVHLAGTETITGAKTFSGRINTSSTTFGNKVCPDMTNTQMLAIATPNNGDCVYNTTNSAPYFYNSTTTVWTAAGGGSGQGGINYIGSNYNAEDTTTTGWSCYADAAGLSVVDGVGGSPNTAISNQSGSLLVGSRSFRITKISGASRQGEGCAFAFSIDPAYKSSVLRITFPYSTSVSIADDDYRIYIYDVTNSRIIEVDNRDLKANAQGQYVGSWQASSDSVSYRLIVHTSTPNNYSSTLDLDNLTVGPQTIYKGPVVTDLGSCSVTVSFATTVNTARCSRTGDSLEVIGEFSLSGTPGAGQLLLTIPSGYNVDTSKASCSLGNCTIEGVAEMRDISVPQAYTSTVHFNGSANQVFFVANGSGAPASNTIPFTWAASDQVHYRFKVPIAGWSSNVAMSEDGGQRLIAAQYVSNGGQAITSAVTDIPFSTSVYDLTASWNGTQFTAPETGYYSFQGQVRISSAANFGLLSYVNGSLIRGLTMDTGTGTGIVRSFSGVQFLTKGQTLSIRSNASATLVTDSNNHWIAIHKIASPQTMAGGPIVHARYSTNAGQSVVHGDIINFEDKEEDTHNAVTIGTGVWKFTAPRPDKYDIEMYTFTNNISDTVGNSFAVPCTINGTTTIRSSVHYVQNTVSHALDSQLAAVVSLNKGDYIQCSFSENVGAISLLSSNEYNYISITSRGN